MTHRLLTIHKKYNYKYMITYMSKISQGAASITRNKPIKNTVDILNVQEYIKKLTSLEDVIITNWKEIL